MNADPARLAGHPAAGALGRGGGAAWLVGGFLAARAALGIAVRQSAVLLALLYGGVYVWCQADSYQHHYHSPPARGARVRPRRRLARPLDAAHRQPPGGRRRQ
ncbi:MAG: hypothetical protein R3F60_30620 [bacterium]